MRKQPEFKTTWERLYDALWKMQEKTKRKRLPYDKIHICLAMTPGMAFSEGKTAAEIMTELEDFGYIRRGKTSFKVLKRESSETYQSLKAKLSKYGGRK